MDEVTNRRQKWVVKNKPEVMQQQQHESINTQAAKDWAKAILSKKNQVKQATENVNENKDSHIQAHKLHC